MDSPQEFIDTSTGTPVHGFLHQPTTNAADCLILTHGAGANCNAPLLVALADAFCASGLAVLRCDLPFRQSRPTVHHRAEARNEISRDSEPPSSRCREKRPAAYISAAIPTEADKRQCSPPPNPASSNLSCYFPTRCTRHSAQPNYEPRTFQVSTLPPSSFSEHETVSPQSPR